MAKIPIAERCREDAIMLHMLGLGEPKRGWKSHRNYFAADEGSDDDTTLVEMEEAGLVRCYRRPTPVNLYAVTDAGKDRIRQTFGPFKEAK